MIKTVKQYVREEVGARILKIVTGSELWFAIALGILSVYYGRDLIGERKLSDISNGLLTYASIAFGFCLSGLAIVLTLPDQAFAKRLAAKKLDAKGHDSYSDLLFVFSWTAVCHWLIIVAMLSAILILGPDEEILPLFASRIHKSLFAVTTMICAYGIFQFLITVITISQVGRLYIANLRDESGRI